MKLATLAAAVVVLTAGCKKSAPADGPDQPPEPKPIGDTGGYVDAPANWRVTEDGKISYRVGLGQGRQVFITEMAWVVKSPEDYYLAECSRYAVAPGIKQTTPAGAYYIQCKTRGTDRAGKAIDLTTVRSIVKVGDKALRCRFETPDDPAKLIEVCKSLRAQR